MKGRRALISVFVTCALAISAAPASAQNASCVGQYASTLAPEMRGDFGADISGFAQVAEPNFGLLAVVPAAHCPR